MKPSVRSIVFRIIRAGWPVAILLLPAVNVLAQATDTRVVYLADLTNNHRQELTQKLQKITGWSDLEFDRDGTLRKGDRQAVGGSAQARQLVATAMSVGKTIVIEDASRDPEVVFARVLPARWKHHVSNSGAVFVIQIDFADFRHVMGDRLVLQAFDVGWVVLHELDHIVNDSIDATHSGETGECEEQINRMRRELNLPERGDYFFNLMSTNRDSLFAARFVRLAFKVDLGRVTKSYWLMWDANLVGGLEEKQVASIH